MSRADTSPAAAASEPVEGEPLEGEEGDEELPRAPWHFKVLLLGTVLYLIYRLIWFIFWLCGHAWHG